jgi:hypothetical protein
LQILQHKRYGARRPVAVSYIIIILIFNKHNKSLTLRRGFLPLSVYTLVQILFIIVFLVCGIKKYQNGIESVIIKLRIEYRFHNKPILSIKLSLSLSSALFKLKYFSQHNSELKVEASSLQDESVAYYT